MNLISRWDSIPVNSREDVIQLIRSFCDVYPGADFSFGHIVLSDFNLSDGHIRWCLEEKQIEQWFAHEKAQLNPEYADPDAVESWKRWQLDDLFEQCEATRQFLQHLLTIPKQLRWE